MLLLNLARLILRHSTTNLLDRSITRPITAGLIAAGFVVACEANGFSWWVTTALTLPVYCALLIGLGAFGVRDMQRLATQMISGLKTRA